MHEFEGHERKKHYEEGVRRGHSVIVFTKVFSGAQSRVYKRGPVLSHNEFEQRGEADRNVDNHGVVDGVLFVFENVDPELLQEEEEVENEV